MELKQAINGFIYTNDHGDVYIYSTLTELAAAVEGRSPGNYTAYAPGKSIVNLREVRGLALNREKISAIKELRNTFTPTLGLKEAKEVVEVLCGLA
jgi:ribosomal protein L7/L12